MKCDEKDKWIFIILALFFGTFGLQWFYLRKTHKGVLYAVFFWTLVPWILSYIHLIRVLFMSQEDFEKKYRN